jgi:hypothetical protein
MTNTELLDKVTDMLYDDESVQLADGFEDAFIGISRQFNRAPFANYDRNKCIEIIIEQGMDEDEAEEYFAFNVEGAYVGESTPAFTIT